MHNQLNCSSQAVANNCIFTKRRPLINLKLVTMLSIREVASLIIIYVIFALMVLIFLCIADPKEDPFSPFWITKALHHGPCLRPILWLWPVVFWPVVAAALLVAILATRIAGVSVWFSKQCVGLAETRCGIPLRKAGEAGDTNRWCDVELGNLGTATDLGDSSARARARFQVGRSPVQPQWWVVRNTGHATAGVYDMP